MAEKKSKNEKLQEKLFLTRKNSWKSYKDQKTIFKFADSYKEFLKESKTERLCIEFIIKTLKDKGFKSFDSVKSCKSGDKLYKNIKDKVILAFIVGKNPNQLRIIGSHVDSPRLDLKPNPLYEDSGFAMMKTHYYGGVKKYHWVNTPLAIIGIIMTKDGKRLRIKIGNEEGDPKFIMPDLLPHLASAQMKKEASKVIEGEEMNILVGNIPIDDEKITEPIKLAVMKHLNEKYNITEEDFNCAELELVPALNPTDIGFDRSLIGAYGQDDRACVYTSLQALVETKNPNHTALAFFVDKEEIGSVGDTGADSVLLNNFAQDYIELSGIKLSRTKLLERSKGISADIIAGMNPNYKDVNDPLNVAYIGKGVTLEKYGGGGGKYSTHDCHAEFMHYIRNLLNKNKIPWQVGELGKLDAGGGGTIAMFMSKYGMDVVDAGICLLGAHSPCEVSSKVDIYSALRLYKTFFKD